MAKRKVNLSNLVREALTQGITVPLDITPDVTDIDNRVDIDDDGTHGADPTPGDRHDTATTPLSVLPALTLDKSADVPTYDAVDDVIHYSYVLTNSGNVTLHAPFTVTDDKTTVDCPATPITLSTK